jgi:Flp pilus assembly protein TadB
MTLLFVAFAGSVLWLAGVIAMIFGLIGTDRPAGPPSAGALLAQRIWTGTGRTPRARQAHRATLAAGVLLGVLAWLFTGLPVVGLLVMLGVPGAPWLFQVGKAERRAIGHIEAVGEWARRLKDVSVVGNGLQQSIVASAGTAPAAIADEVRDLSVRLQAGVNPHEALTMFADDIADPVCDQVVAALMLHLTDRGDRLGDILTSIAAAASAEVATRREVDAKRTQSRFAVKFLTITTLGTIAYGAIRPGYMKPYETPFGQIVMIVQSILFVGILLWVRSMSQPERSPRFLDSNRPGVEA